MDVSFLGLCRSQPHPLCEFLLSCHVSYSLLSLQPGRCDRIGSGISSHFHDLPNLSPHTLTILLFPVCRIFFCRFVPLYDLSFNY